jgi:hypothetical protein
MIQVDTLAQSWRRSTAAVTSAIADIPIANDAENVRPVVLPLRQQWHAPKADAHMSGAVNALKGNLAALILAKVTPHLDGTAARSSTNDDILHFPIGCRSVKGWRGACGVVDCFVIRGSGAVAKRCATPRLSVTTMGVLAAHHRVTSFQLVDWPLASRAPLTVSCLPRFVLRAGMCVNCRSFERSVRFTLILQYGNAWNRTRVDIMLEHWVWRHGDTKNVPAPTLAAVPSTPLAPFRILPS